MGRRSGTEGGQVAAGSDNLLDAGPDDEDINFIWRSLGRRFNGLLRAAPAAAAAESQKYLLNLVFTIHKNKSGRAKVLAIVCSQCALLNTMQGSCI